MGSSARTGSGLLEPISLRLSRATADAIETPVEALVVINGPIAAGKSTVAQALGRRLRQTGHPAAVVDLDEL